VSTEPELSRSAYVVLGLVARYGPLTPYDLKARVADSVGHFWPIPRAQLYRDAPRLAELGYLEERAEQGGRRRRVFALTPVGRDVLDAWLADATTTDPETRDPALLKLAFADLSGPQELSDLAVGQAARHAEWLADYRARRASLDPSDPASVARARVLALAILHEQTHVDFWSALADPARAAALGDPTADVGPADGGPGA
jgi:DNA-binding PadR family transcriptional regulator